MSKGKLIIYIEIFWKQNNLVWKIIHLEKELSMFFIEERDICNIYIHDLCSKVSISINFKITNRQVVAKVVHSTLTAF